MTEADFLRAFSQPWKTPTSAHEAFLEATRPAAVLICLYHHNNKLHVLFTERASHLKHHAGQISFPGGKAEEFDASLVHTAYREAQEEIGLDSNHLRLLGQLGTYRTISGFTVTPILSVYDQPLSLEQDLVLDANEVASVFHVPLKYLMDKAHYYTEEVQRNGRSFTVHFVPYGGRMIWGATAGMLVLLRDHILANS